jgi:hypothetical protein
MSNIIKKIAARAKQIRKAHPSKTWQACIKQASKELKGKSIGAKQAAPKKKAVKKPASRQTGKSSKLHDERYQAKAPGKRMVKTTNGSHVYYERRKNRSDVPGSLSGKVGTLNTEASYRGANVLPKKPKLKFSISWGGTTMKGYVINDGDHGLLYVENKPLIRKYKKYKYTILQGGFLMAAVLKKYGYEVNAGGSIFVPRMFYEANNRKSIEGLTFKQIKDVQKKF